ncbi:MAG: hypothetical protein ACRD3E_12375 [Terriglobales bacterium]
MHRPCLGTLFALFVILFPVLAGATAGSFRGVIVSGPNDQPGWIWVKGAHSTLRKVEVSRAQVVYDQAVPSSDRQPQPRKSIKSGVEVRVTAEQDGHGEWRASRVEILNLRAADPSIAPSPSDPGRFRRS